jgi:hypothetical protein
MAIYAPGTRRLLFFRYFSESLATTLATVLAEYSPVILTGLCGAQPIGLPTAGYAFEPIPRFEHLTPRR